MKKNRVKAKQILKAIDKSEVPVSWHAIEEDRLIDVIAKELPQSMVLTDEEFKAKYKDFDNAVSEKQENGMNGISLIYWFVGYLTGTSNSNLENTTAYSVGQLEKLFDLVL